MNSVLISVVIPFYKRVDLLRETLQSVCEAKLDDVALEVILVDDCSPEKLEEADLEQFRKEGLSISIYQNESNAGPGPSRMNGLARAKGKYVHFMDSDDLILPGFYSKLSTVLETDQSLAMVYGYTQYLEGGIIQNAYKREQCIYNNIMDCVMEKGRVWSTSACLWRTETVKKSKGWLSGVWEDYYFDVAVALINPKINAVPENLVLYRIHQDIRFSSVDSMEKHWSRLSMIYKTRSMLEEYGAEVKYIKWINAVRNRFLLWALNATTKETLKYSMTCLLKLDAKFLPLFMLSKNNRWRILKRR